MKKFTGEDNPMALFDERLRAVLKEKKMSQTDLCRKAGIPKSAMSQYVSGKFIPRHNRVAAMAEALEVEVAWLLGLESCSDLDDRERELIWAYRHESEFKEAVDSLMEKRIIFRAAKSEDGSIAPMNEEVSKAELEKLALAPETDQEF